MSHTRQTITEAQAEAAADRRVQQILTTDRRYRYAATAEAQAEREQEIADTVWASIQAAFEVQA